MNRIIIDKNDALYKSNIQIIYLILIFACIGNILFYVTEEDIFCSTYAVLMTLFMFGFSYFIKSAFSYSLYIFSLYLYFIFLSIGFQIYYSSKYISSYTFIFILYLILLFLVFLDYLTLKRKGLFNRIFTSFDKSIVHVVDVFGERTSYLKISKARENKHEIKISEGNIFFTIILGPILLISFTLSPFVKSVPVLAGYFISKFDTPIELDVMFICTLLLNFIFFKYIYIGYSAVLYFYKK